MAIGSRGEGGVGGGGRGTIFTGMGPKKAAPKKSTAKKAVLTKEQKAAIQAKKAAAARKAASTSSVKVIPKGPNSTPLDAALRRKQQDYTMKMIKSGEVARLMGNSVNIGTPKARVKIDSAIKTAKPSAATIKATKKALKRISK